LKLVGDLTDLIIGIPVSLKKFISLPTTPALTTSILMMGISNPKPKKNL
jgi:hypothetical protein